MLQAVFKVGRTVGKAIELNHNVVVAFKADNWIALLITINVSAQSVHTISLEIKWLRGCGGGNNQQCGCQYRP